MSAVAVEDWRTSLTTRLERVMPAADAMLALPLIEDIRALKVSRNAVIVAHNYQVPEITAGIADFTGDSLAMAKFAMSVDAPVIVVCGVRFMAETAKILNPDRTILLPAEDAGCSLAEAVSPGDLRNLRAQYPGVPIVAYVNTTAAVTARGIYSAPPGTAARARAPLRGPFMPISAGCPTPSVPRTCRRRRTSSDRPPP